MTYEQLTGKLSTNEGKILNIGYAGHGQGKNNPQMQDVHNIGPIPKGKYTIGPWYDSPHTGPFTLPLTPDASNEMFGRSDFKIHGDSINAPGTASNGCIIMPHDIRIKINSMSDKCLTVI